MSMFEMTSKPGRIVSIVRIVIALCLGVSIGLVSYANKCPQQDSPVKVIGGHIVLKTLKNEHTVMVEHVLEEQLGRYWIVNNESLVIYEEKKDQWTTSYTYSAVPYSSMCLSSDNMLWYSSQSSIRPVLRVLDGKKWSKLNARTYPPSFSADKFIVSAMFCRSGVIWFAIKDKLLSYDGTKWSSPISVPPEGDSPSGVIRGLVDSEGLIWLQTTNGIAQFDERTRVWKTYFSPVTSPNRFLIYEAREGRIWFVSPNGMASVYDKASYSWVTHNILDCLRLQTVAANGSLSSPLITSVYQDKDGQMMFATRFGLMTFRESANTCELFTPTNSGLPSEGVIEIIEDKQGRIWVTTYDGISILKP
jgi:ligand-binding sensor domain-containing protein